MQNVSQKLKNKSLAKRKAKRASGTPKNAEKSVVLSIIANGKTVTNYVVESEKARHLLPVLRSVIKEGSTIVTDELQSYKSLSDKYTHISVNHSQNNYVNNGFTTNNVEGYFSHLKRAIIGIYHQVSRQHLHRYCDEFAFRYNNRDLDGTERFNLALQQAFGRLKYNQLIGR